MKNKFGGAKFITATVVCLVWIILFVLSLVLKIKILTWSLVVIGPGIILVYYLFFSSEIFLFLTVFFVPLSIKIEMPGGMAVEFPSEIMAVLLLYYFIINKSSIRIPDRRIFSHPIFLLLIVYLAWMIITSALSEIPSVSFKRTFIQALYFVVFYFLFLTRFDKAENIVRFFLFYSLGLVIPILNGIIWHSQYQFSSQASYYMPQPFFIEHTIYGAALAFILPMLFYIVFVPNQFVGRGRNKWRLALLLFLIVLAEFLAFSRAAWLSVIVLPFMLFIISLKLRKALLFLIFLGILSGFLINSDHVLSIINQNEARSNQGNIKEQIKSASNIRSDISNLERINRWKCAFRMFESKPVTGYGPGTYQFVYGRFQVKKEMTRISTYHGEKGNAHSEYLGFLAESGFPALIIYLCLILAVLSTAIRIIHRSTDRHLKNLTIAVLLSILTFYFHTIFNGFLETEKIGSLYYGSLAAITALDVYFFRKMAV